MARRKSSTTRKRKTTTSTARGSGLGANMGRTPNSIGMGMSIAQRNALRRAQLAAALANRMHMGAGYAAARRRLGG